MKRKMLSIGIGSLTAISGVITLYNLLILYLIPMFLRMKISVSIKDAAAIGIIGSADGPTAILLTTNKNSGLQTLAFLLLFILGVVYFITMRVMKINKAKLDE